LDNSAKYYGCLRRSPSYRGQNRAEEQIEAFAMRDYPESVLKAVWARVRRPSCKTIQALQWLSGNNPAEKAAKVKEPHTKIRTLTVNEAARLLESATPDVLPYLAIGLFAGLRSSEIERLHWRGIDFERGLIKVDAKKSRNTTLPRLVTIQPNLREWLISFRKLGRNVTPENGFRQSFEQARAAAGIVDWPYNALRHSFASYHLAHFKNAASTALELGQNDSRITFAHYRELVKPKDAERYWNIKPANVGSRSGDARFEKQDETSFCRRPLGTGQDSGTEMSSQ
jgi:integrase